MNNPLKPATFFDYPSVALFLLCLVLSFATHSESETSKEATEEQAAKLESLKIHIKETEKDLTAAAQEKNTLSEELKQNEIRIGEVATRIALLRDGLTEKREKLQILRQQEQQQQQLLKQERTTLATQIQAAYVTGRADYIKLLLNQEDPARIGRVMAYYEYHNRSRSQIIQTAITKLQTLFDLEQSIEKESAEIIALEAEQQQRMQEYAHSRELRESILLQLDQYIHNKDIELQTLNAEAKELGELLTKLDKKNNSTIEFFEDIPPFKKMRGKMEWPIQGSIVQYFGSHKKGNDLRWNGVLIKAKTGTEVKAINNGRVIFADWFKNLGMLIIVDHGEDYMSLYAHNESLLKKPDDWVLAGEAIASVGDSGGQNQAGLYFEIRKKGKPVNPSLWCKK